MKRQYLWLTAIVLYAAFFSWYTNLNGPMQEDEIKEALLRAEAQGRSTQSLNNLENFMRSDSGDDFIMVNLIDLNESPRELTATGPDAGPMELLNYYMEHMSPRSSSALAIQFFSAEQLRMHWIFPGLRAQVTGIKVLCFDIEAAATLSQSLSIQHSTRDMSTKWRH